MKSPSEWTEADLRTFLSAQTPEGLDLEYKDGRLAEAGDGGARELSVAVSAFANAVGGLILLGVEERKNQALRYALTIGVDRSKMYQERLAQIIAGNVRPKVQGLRIHSILVTAAPDRCVYAIEVPQAAPGNVHQASDRVFYRRHTDQCLAMEEYEVRQAYGRSDSPHLRVTVSPDKAPGNLLEPWASNGSFYVPIRLGLAVENLSDTVAEYAVIQMNFDKRVHVVELAGRMPIARSVHLFNLTYDTRGVEVHWNSAARTPLFRGTPIALLPGMESVHAAPPIDNAQAGSIPYLFWWSVRAPHMAPAAGAFVVVMSRGLIETIEHIREFKEPEDAVDEERWLILRSVGR